MPISSLKTDTGVYFVKKDLIHSSFGEWNIIFTKNFNEIEKLLRTSISMHENFQRLFLQHKEKIRSTLFPQKLQVLHFKLLTSKTIFNSLMESHESTPSISKRTKRALLPFLGSGLKSLIGTATESDVKFINNKVKLLTDNQKSVLHVLDEHLSLINSTYRKTAYNSEQIRNLHNTIIAFHNKINSALISYNQTQLAINKLNLIQQFSRAFTYLSEYVDYSYESITLFVTEVEIALGEILPQSFISVPRLRRTLINVKRMLPSSVQLPFDLQNDILKYYREFPLRVSIVNKQLNILMRIPVITKLPDTLYHVINVPIPGIKMYSADIIHISYDFLIVNHDNSTYINLNTASMSHCFGQTIRFCNIDRPAYHFNKAPSCESSLYRGDGLNVAKLCSRQNISMNTPVAVKIKTNNWVVSSPFAWVAHTVCLQKTTQSNLLNFNKGIFYYVLPESCSFYGKYFNLPTSFHHALSISVRGNVFQSEIHMANFSVLNLSLISPLAEIKSQPQLVDTSNLDLNFSLIHSQTKDLYVKNEAVRHELYSNNNFNIKMFVLIIVISILFTVIIFIYVLWKFQLIGKNVFRSKSPLLLGSVKSTSEPIVIEM